MASHRVSLLLVVVLLTLDYCFTATIQSAYDPSLNDEIILTAKKRPFCNAFTGCGRKRSDLNPGMVAQEFRQRQLTEDTEPYIDSDNVNELSRQIIAEAKLWEALQEANSELSRRKQKYYE